MQTIQTSLQKDDISWDYWLFCRGCSWTMLVKLFHILDIKQLPFLLCERDYCMLSALLKYGPLILHPWVWLYILWSSLKHIQFLRYPATEPNHRSPPVPFVLWFEQSLHFLSAHQALHIYVGWRMWNASAISRYCWTVHWEASQDASCLKTMLWPEVLRAFVSSVLRAAVITQTLRVSKGEQVNPLKGVLCSSPQKAFLVLVLLHCISQH